jgi:hypothetical protein
MGWVRRLGIRKVASPRPVGKDPDALERAFVGAITSRGKDFRVRHCP